MICASIAVLLVLGLCAVGVAAAAFLPDQLPPACRPSGPPGRDRERAVLPVEERTARPILRCGEGCASPPRPENAAGRPVGS
jgi:hypothetical protein